MDDHDLAWALHLAAGAGDEASVWQLLREGRPTPAATATTTRGRTALHAAAAAKSEGAVAALLAAAPAMAAAADAFSRQVPLHFAAAAGARAASTVLVAAAPAALEAFDWDDSSPLDLAARAGHEAVAQDLLAATPADKSAAPEFRQRLLLSAAQGGLAPLVQHALGGGLLPDPSAVVWAMCSAAEAGHEPVVRLMLDHAPAAAMAADEEDMSPLHHAAAGAHQGVVRLLLAASPQSANIPDWEGNLPLHWAIRGHGAGTAGGREAVVRLLLEADPTTATAIDMEGDTPLHCTARVGRVSLVEILLEAAPDMALAVNLGGHTPLHLAARDGKTAAIELLLAAGPAWEACMMADKRGNTPLHLAAKAGSAAAVARLLVTAPDAAMERNASGWLPLELALAQAVQQRGRPSIDGAGWTPQAPRTPCRTSKEVEAARFLLNECPTHQLLPSLVEAGKVALPLYADLVSQCRLLAHEWQLLPVPCPGLGPLLPGVLARCEQEAGCLVSRLPRAGRRRLRTAALGLARAQRRLGVPLPTPLVWRMLAHIDC